VLQPKQLRISAAARECDRPGGPTEVGFGGARGGGKSHWELAQIGVDDCQRAAGIQALLLRKVGKSLTEAFEDLRRRVLMGTKHRYRSSDGTVTFDNGSVMRIGHFQRESDVDVYLGLQYDVIGVEEGTTLTASKMKFIRSCNRTSRTDFRPRIYTTTNPGGVGHQWYKATYVDPRKRAPWARFVPSTIDDNAFVNAEYRDILERFTGWQLRAYRYGDWDIAAGQYFTTWLEEAHVRPSTIADPNWTYWLAMDYGFIHPTVWGLLGRDNEGNRWLIDEYGASRQHPRVHAECVKEMLARHGLTVEHMQMIVGSPDAFARRAQSRDDPPRSIADDYADEGIFITRANNDRILGAGQILKLLGDPGNPERPTLPRFFVMDRCANTIEQIPAMQHDPKRPEDVLKVDIDEDGVGGDDFYDMARYGVMAVAGEPASGAGLSSGSSRRAGYEPS